MNPLINIAVRFNQKTLAAVANADWTRPGHESPILVVESEGHNELPLKLALQNAGILNPIVSFPNPDAVTKYIRGTGAYANREEYPLPCVILMDVTMPEMNFAPSPVWLSAPPVCRQIVVSFLCGTDKPEFESSVPFGRQAVLCKLPTTESLMGMLKKLQDALVREDANILRPSFTNKNPIRRAL